VTTFGADKPAPAEDLLRELAPQVLGALLRRYGRFDECEDAVQEALLAAVIKWPDAGIPAHPRSWLITVATRRLVDQWRADSARRNREVTAALMTPSHRTAAPAADSDEITAAADDTLTLLVLCCHPDLPEASRIALTLRAAGGLTTAEIARAFLVSEPTMAQRISRAKQQLKAVGARFEDPPPVARARGDVLHVLYLIFNEGYTATSGPSLHRIELSAEAIRLTRVIHRLLPDDGEVAGLLALMLLTDARRPARCGPDDNLVPLEEQDRSLWDTNMIREGLSLINRSLTATTLGPYQLQAAIAAVHAEAAQASDTDWRQILALYLVLERFTPTPIVRLNRAVATAMAHGPQAGLDLLASVESDSRTAAYHRLAAVRAHMLEMAGDFEAAQRNYLLAARRTTSLPERRYLELRAARAGGNRQPADDHRHRA
jgi:RNA polymerase sigma factor (sigma-70 family)